MPGSTDPNHKDSKHDYSKRYRLVSDEALKRGYKSIEIISWIGQNSGQNGIMNLDTASNYLKIKMIDLENGGTPYDIFAFSWGANVCLKTLFDIEEPNYLQRTVLWGIDEYWRMVKYFDPYTDTCETIIGLKKKGASIKSDFLTYEFSNEFLLCNYRHKNKVLVAFGENDDKSSPAFADYLKSFVTKSNISYHIVAEVGHVVSEYNEEYLNCLFGDKC